MLRHEKATALLSGATAGLCVDLVVYPLDTIKTRLQSITRSTRPYGRLHLFAGFPAVLSGSAPGGLLFNHLNFFGFIISITLSFLTVKRPHGSKYLQETLKLPFY